MQKLTFKRSPATAFLETYIGGEYCGYLQPDSVAEMKRFAAAFRRSPRLSATVAEIMGRTGGRPLGGFAGETEVKAWIDRNRFGRLLYWDHARGILWAPVAWSVALRLARQHERARRAA